MDFVHCNHCFQRNSKEGYILSSCFHIFCHKCVKKDATSCPLCNKKIRLVLLDGNISSGVKAYFADPLKLITDNLTKLQRKFEFQENMRVRLLKHLIKEKEKKRQMELYFRKKGQEFESQKKKLAEATAWIQAAERRLQASEEEKLKAQKEMEEMRAKLKLLSNATSQQHHASTSSYSFIPPDSPKPGMAASMIESSPNSTFNLVSPLVHSPALSHDSVNYQGFFANGEVQSTGTEGFNDELMFNTISSGQSAQANVSNSSAFSAAFNNMFTPNRNLNATSHSMANQTVANQTALNKTSISLDNWRQSESNSFGKHDMSKKDSSLPLKNCVTSSARHHQYTHEKVRNAPPPSQHRRSMVMDRQQLRDMRRISSQPGYLAQKKSINNRSNYMEHDN
ncbi:unnamed protein product [Caenorhabditis nigoni]